MSVTTDIAAVQADIQKLNSLWNTAQQQYEARKAVLTAQVDSYIAAHQTAADSHSAEIQAALALKAKLVSVAAGIETAGSELQFLLTKPWYTRFIAFTQRNWRWVTYSAGLTGMVWAVFHLHK